MGRMFALPQFALLFLGLLVVSTAAQRVAAEPTNPGSIAGSEYGEMSDEGPCCEQDAAANMPPLPDYSGCLWCRSALTGDWHGRRSCQAENGITFNFDHTHFYHGVVDGGIDQEFAYGGHGDYVANVDFGRLGVQQGLFLKVRAEHRWGETIAGNSGAFLPPTVAANLPVADSENLYVTNFLVTQALSEKFALFVGKLDSLDGDGNAFAHGRGKTQFSNMGFVANPLGLRTVPYSTIGMGFVVLHELQPVFTFTALNPTDTTRTIGLEDLYEEGVTLSAELRLPVSWRGLPGHQLFAGTWSSRDVVSLGQDPRIILPDVPVALQPDSWSLFWNFDQYLYVDPCNPAWGWGVFGRAGVADVDTNPLEFFLSAGLGGNSPIQCREQDTFGIGWYYAGSSGEIGPVLQAVLGPIADGQAVELFYNAAVTPWFHLTADLQIIEPARQNIDSSVIFGLRGKVDF